MRFVEGAPVCEGEEGAAGGVEGVGEGGEEGGGSLCGGGPDVEVVGVEAVGEEVLVEVGVYGGGVVECAGVVSLED